MVSEIVNGEERLDADECGVGVEMIAKINRRQRGLPVMRVDDVGSEQITRNGQAGHGEHGEAKMIVGMSNARGGIDAGPVEQRRAMNKVERDAALSGLIQVRHETGTDWDPEIAVSDGGRIRIKVLAVVGNHDGDLFATGRERRR